MSKKIMLIITVEDQASDTFKRIIEKLNNELAVELGAVKVACDGLAGLLADLVKEDLAAQEFKTYLFASEKLKEAFAWVRD